MINLNYLFYLFQPVIIHNRWYNKVYSCVKMKVRQPIEHRSTNHPDPVRVYINNSLLEVEFEHPSKDVTITIINSETGKTIYYEKITFLEKVRLIDLSEEDKKAEYTLEISTSSWFTTGIFTID